MFHTEIATWFLFLGLFLPRITLIIAYCSGQIPANDIPFIGDVFMAIFVPRVLICIYIFEHYGFCGWLIIHMIFAAIALFSSGTTVTKHNQ